MRKKLFGLVAVSICCGFLVGCGSVQGYSLRSYQGPLPMSDYQYVNPDSYGAQMPAH
jgi:hypothetical protein